MRASAMNAFEPWGGNARRDSGRNNGCAEGGVEAASGLASRYALALYDYAAERSVLPDVLDQVRSLRKLIAESVPLRDFLNDQTLDSRQSAKAFDAVLRAQGFGDTICQFANVVARNRRLSRLSEILGAVMALDAHRRGEIVAEYAARSRSTWPSAPTCRRVLQRPVTPVSRSTSASNPN